MTPPITLVTSPSSEDMALRLPAIKLPTICSPTRSAIKMKIIPRYEGTTKTGTITTVNGTPARDNVPNVLRESGMIAV